MVVHPEAIGLVTAGVVGAAPPFVSSAPPLVDVRLFFGELGEEG